MPKNISFAMTQSQILAETKTVTRRIGWKFLKGGERLNAVDRTMGFKKGESPKKLKLLYVKSVRREPLEAITKEDLIKEGFPDMDLEDFIQMFMKSHKCFRDTSVTRIEFTYL